MVRGGSELAAEPSALHVGRAGRQPCDLQSRPRGSPARFFPPSIQAESCMCDKEKDYWEIKVKIVPQLPQVNAR